MTALRMMMKKLPLIGSLIIILRVSIWSFDEIANGADLSQYRVLWWIRDSQQTTDLPAESLDPSVVEAIKKFHIDGGGLLLNTHAVAYLYTIGRMKAKFNTEFTSGDGFDNGDTWNMNVYIGKVTTTRLHILSIADLNGNGWMARKQFL
ncbi:MAG: DUF4960 domain-containing protein [Bacteroides stercoris]